MITPPRHAITPRRHPADAAPPDAELVAAARLGRLLEVSSLDHRDPVLAERRDVLVLIGGCLLLLLLVKLYLRFSWLLPGSASVRLRRTYRALASRLHDLGYPRRYGETREEYRHRLSEERGLQTLEMNNLLLPAVYRAKSRLSISLADLQRTRRSDSQGLRAVRWWQKILAALNPASIFVLFSTRRW